MKNTDETKVYFFSCLNYCIGQINESLKEAGEVARFSQTLDLFRLWVDAYDDGNKKEAAEKKFGEVYKKFGSSRLMFTLTGDGKQLRVWYGIPGFIRYDHVDRGGRDCLFEVVGEAHVVKEYLDALLGCYKLTEVFHPTGTKLYMQSNYR